MFIKKLNYKILKKQGRNGKLLCRTKGALKIKLLYRIIDFYMTFLINNCFIYLKYINDFFRNAKLVLCLSIVGFVFYIIGPSKLKFPQFYNLMNLKNFIYIKYGQPIQLKRLTEGNFVYYFSFYINYYAQICRSAGKFGQILKLFFLPNYSLIKLKNHKKILINNTNYVIFGSVNNEEYYNLIKAKAGFNQSFGFKSIVRGVAMNPIDHPNGGRTPGGKVYKSFSFLIAKNLKKTSSTKFRNFFINNNY